MIVLYLYFSIVNNSYGILRPRILSLNQTNGPMINLLIEINSFQSIVLTSYNNVLKENLMKVEF